MKAWQNLKIGMRLGIGIGALLLMLLVVAGAAYFSLQGANGNFGDYRLLARRTATVGVLDGDLLTVRVQVKSFLLKDSPEAAKKAIESLQALLAECAKSADLFKGTPDEAVIASVDERAQAYQEGFKKVVDLMQQRDVQVARMNEVGPKIEKDLSALMETANSDGDSSASFHAGEVLRNLLIARIYAMKFLKENDQEQVDRVRKELASFSANAAQLRAALNNPARAALLDDVVNLEKSYTDAFEQMQATIFARNQIIDGTLDKIGPAVSADLGKVADASKAAQDQLGPRASADMMRGIVITLVVSALAVVMGILIGFAVARSITKPIVAMTGSMGRLAEGDLAIEVPARGRKDEIGAMAAAVQVFKDNMIRNKEMQAREAAELEARAQRAQIIAALTQAFDREATAVVKTVSAAATQMQGTATAMSATAEQTARQATAVAAASEEASTNVQTVASATEELTASISEITTQVTESTRIVGEAVTQATDTSAKVQGLSDAAQKIGDVVRLINDIAGQTNLLALNATIEAARAGEAGKGFAVVASEVKILATQTAKATDEIASQVRAIQEATATSAQAIQSITHTIGRVSEISTAIASAVEEQGAATQEIARNVQQAAVGTQEVSSNIGAVTDAARDTGSAANQLLAGSSDLAKQAEVMRAEVEKYIAGINAA